MEDSKAIASNGSATPYLAIFDGRSKPIVDPFTGFPIGIYVVNFEYVYDEEDDDTFEITLNCDNPDLIDLPQLGYQMPLLLQWGWIFSDGSSNCGPVRKVVIRDSESNFTESGVRIILKGTDAFALTKTTPANLEDETLVKWIKNNLEGKFQVDLIDYKVQNKISLVKGGDQ